MTCSGPMNLNNYNKITVCNSNGNVSRLTNKPLYVSVPRTRIETIMSQENKQTIDFEGALKELEALVEKMEQGDLSLEQSLEHFERGVRLTRDCQQALAQAKLKISELLSPDSSDASPASTCD